MVEEINNCSPEEIAFMTMVRSYIRKYTNTRNGNAYLPYQNYDLDKLQEAVNCVKDGRMSLTQAANTYGIPKSTLSRKTRNINCTQASAGHPTLFTPEEENIFLKYILLVGEWGFPFDTTDLRVFAQKYLNKIGKNIYGLEDNLPGVDWARNFLRRHSTLISNRKSANISTDRAKITCQDIDDFFEHYTKTVEGVAADCIINYDETNLTDDPGNKNYIYKRGCKYPERIINNSKTSISLMFSGTASGQVLPMYVVYKSENLWDTWMEAGPEGTRYNRSKSGWFDSVCFEDWFNTIIVPYVRNKEGPKVLIGDNLSSHFSESVLRTCEEFNIAFVCLPPKTTHLLQPLDVAFFAPLKAYWRDVLTKWKLTEGRKHKTLVKSAFPKLLCKLKDKLVEKDNESNNLKAGFNKSGLYPVDPNRPKSRLPQSETTRPEAEIEDAASSAITNILMEIRSPVVAEQGTRRKKRFIVEPGKSVTAEDLSKHQNKQTAISKRKKRSNEKAAISKTSRKKTSKSSSKSKPDQTQLMPDQIESMPDQTQLILDPYIDPIPSTSGLCNINNTESDMSDEEVYAPVSMPMPSLGPIEGKGKGIGKKTKPTIIEIPSNEKQPKEKRTKKKKQIRKSKDSSTSVSDCDIMSTHNDSDIGDCVSDVEDDEFDFAFGSNSETKTKTADKTDLIKANDETDLIPNAKYLVVSEIANTNEDYEHQHEAEMVISEDHSHSVCDEMTNTTEDIVLNHESDLVISQDPLYTKGNIVLVRYFIKKTWTYYVGNVQEINKEICGYKYTVVFFKTVKKPSLAFRKTRLIDRDIVDDLSIVKQIVLKESSNNRNELLLAEEGDMVYFK